MKLKKFLIVVFCMIIINSLFFANNIFAVQQSSGNFGSDLFEQENVNVPAEVQNFTNSALGIGISIARTVGTGIAIITLIVIACKYMIAAPGDRADIKKHAIPYVIGACVVFGASAILGIIVDFASNLDVSRG